MLNFIYKAIIKPEEKRFIRIKLKRYWRKFLSKDIEDLGQKMISSTLSLFKSLFFKRESKIIRFLSIFAFSFMLTSIALVLGRYLETYDRRSFITCIEKVLYGLIPFRGAYQSQYVLPINFVFDFLTIIVTIKILEKLTITKSFYMKAILVITDILFAFICSLFTMSFVKFATRNFRYTRIDGSNSFFECIVSSFENYDNLTHMNFQSVDFDGLLLGITTFLPTIVYFIILTFLLIVLISDRITKGILRTINERVKRNIGELSGSQLCIFFGTLANFIGFIIAYFK